MDASFLELKSKQVVNTVDGKCLGHVTDIIFDVVTACCLGFVVPQPNQGFFGLFRSGKDIFIPFDCVCKLGVDVILVELYIDEHEKNGHNPKDGGKHKCSTQNIDINNKK
jgi:YlmC/YmxH family sporulation protein